MGGKKQRQPVLDETGREVGWRATSYEADTDETQQGK